ncbi:epidermal differentiation-specific protein-like [Discoglossus pictus]
MSENKIILFEKPSFEGLSVELSKSNSDLVSENFANATSSLRVFGQPWVVHTLPNFRGDSRVYEEGSYANVDLNNKINSITLISTNLESPAIKLFDGQNYTGNSIVVKEAAILDFGILQSGALSWTVLSGAWKVCDEVREKPRYIVANAGNRTAKPTDVGLRYAVLSVFPLLPGSPKYTTNVQWDRKKELSSHVSQLDELIVINRSKHGQNFSHTAGRSYASSVEVEMNFSNETTIEVGATFSIPLIGELSTKVSNTFSVEKGKTESTNTTVTTKVSVPVSVPPKTKVTINVMRKDVSYSIPVEVVIERNKVKKTEYATLVCRDATHVQFSRNDEALS